MFEKVISNYVLSSNVSMSMSVACIAKRKGGLYLLSREHPETESFQARSPRYNGMSEDGGVHEAHNEEDNEDDGGDLGIHDEEDDEDDGGDL